MNGTDAYSLVVGALRKTVAMIEAYDDDPDAIAGDVLEDIRALSEDMLGVLDRHYVDLAADTGQDEDGRTMREQYRDQVAATQEP